MGGLNGRIGAVAVVLLIVLFGFLPSCASYPEHVVPSSGESLQPGYARIERWRQVNAYMLQIDVACAIASKDWKDSASSFLYRVKVEPEHVFDAVDTRGLPVELEDDLARFRRENPDVGCILTRDILLRTEPLADEMRIEVYRTYVGLVKKVEVRDVTLRKEASWIRTKALR
jgi:hypothetical protein